MTPRTPQKSPSPAASPPSPNEPHPSARRWLTGPSRRRARRAPVPARDRTPLLRAPNEPEPPRASHSIHIPRTNPAPAVRNEASGALGGLGRDVGGVPWSRRRHRRHPARLRTGPGARPRTNPAPPHETKPGERGAGGEARGSRRRTKPMVVRAIPHAIRLLIPPAPNEPNGSMVKREKVNRQPGARRAAARNEPNGALGGPGQDGGHRRPSGRFPRTNPAPVPGRFVRERAVVGPGRTSPNEPSAAAESPDSPLPRRIPERTQP
jgi:hypothetical protein